MTTLTFKQLNKKGTAAIYSGLRVALRIPIGAFVDKDPLPSFSDFSGFAGPKVAKVKLSKEERAALPKPTLAERLKQSEAKMAREAKRMADLRAKLEASMQPVGA